MHTMPGFTFPYPDLPALAQCRVLVVGDAMLDRYWFGGVERISPEAPVPVIRVERQDERLGGAANVALNVRRLGAQASLMTVLGDDEPAHVLQNLLEQEGIEALFKRDASLVTTVKLRMIGRSQQLLRADFEKPPTNEALAQMVSAFEQALPGCNAILFSDYGKGGLSHVARMIELARAAQKPVLIDPKGSDYSRYAGASVITPNRAELMQVVGTWRDEQDLFERAHRLRETLGLEAILLTRSEEGMSLFDVQQGQPSRFDVPAMAREVFDVTGAGDTVIATCATMLGCGLSLRDTVFVANRAGAIVVGKFGTASVSYEELFG